MVLMKIFKKLSPGYSRKELKNRMKHLEQKVQFLEMTYQDKKNTEPPIIVERLNIEKIIVDKVEYHNNFGALGIKELRGKLNIGANYGVDTPEFIAKQEESEIENKKEARKQSSSANKPTSREKGPSYHIQGRKK